MVFKSLEVCSACSNAPSSLCLLEGRWSGTRLSLHVFLHCPEQITLSTYDLIMLDFAFFIMALITRKNEAFFVSSCSWGFGVRFVRDSGKLLEHPLWISWPNFFLCFEYICCYVNLMIMKTLQCLISTAQMRGGGGNLCWPVREYCYWYSWGKQISAHFAYLISICF